MPILAYFTGGGMQSLPPTPGAAVEKERLFVAGDWKDDWNAMVNAIGHDFGTGSVRVGADPVERSTIRRFLEPIEFDCPLHYDESVALAHGYPTVVAPYSSVMTWTIPPLWEPGHVTFRSEERDSQPSRPQRNAAAPQLPAPATTHFFATDIEIEYSRPILLGDHLSVSGRKLLSCVPKETSVGRGAFTFWESVVHNQRGERVATLRTGSYDYNPHQRPSPGDNND